MRYNLLLTVLLLTSCSLISDAILKSVAPDTGISVDAQIGDTENKVKTGIGAIGKSETKVDTKTVVEDSDHVKVQTQTQTGKYQLQSDKNLTVNVYETNKYLYLLFALWVIGKPLFRWWEARNAEKKRR